MPLTQRRIFNIIISTVSILFNDILENVTSITSRHRFIVETHKFVAMTFGDELTNGILELATS